MIDHNPKAPLPKISFVIPVFNEEESISLCLNSILSSGSPRDTYEIIVVDNGSSDGSTEIVKKYESINLIEAPNCNVGKVRNMGAQEARAKHIVFIDGDCTIPNGFIHRVFKLISDSPGKVFGGGILLPDNPTWIEEYWTLQSDGRSQLPSKIIGASILIPKQTLFDVNGFDENLSSSEDSDLHDRLVDQGISISITNDLDVIHLGNAKNIRAFIKRQTWHSENYFKNLKKSIKDPIFIITVTALVLTSAIALSITTSNGIPIFETAALFTTPLILSIKRIYRSKKPASHMLKIPAIYLIDALYVIGRCQGLILGIAHLAVKKTKTQKTKNL